MLGCAYRNTIHFTSLRLLRPRCPGHAGALEVPHRIVNVAHSRARQRDRDDGDIVSLNELSVRLVTFEVDLPVALACSTSAAGSGK